MQKQELRKMYREKRNALSAIERMKLDDLLLIQFQKANLPFINTLLTYWPIDKNHEPNAHLFTDYLEFKNPGLTITFPKADFLLNEMIAVTVQPESDFIKNEHDIFEPIDGDVISAYELDMILVPLLSLDSRGFRVGYGKGFYDRYLKDCKRDCVKIGFSYFPPVDEITDTDEFDVPLDLCITPDNIYVF